MIKLAGAVHAAGKQLTDDGLKAAWVALDTIKSREEKPIEREHSRYMKMQGASVVERWYQIGGGQLDANVKSLPDDAILGELVFDIGEWLASMAEDFEPLILRVMEQGFRTGALSINESLRFNLTPRAGRNLAKSIERIQGTNIHTRNVIGGIIRRGIEDGLSVDEVAEALRDKFKDWSVSRSRTVAQTETTNAFESAQQDAWIEAEVERNRWLSMRDDRVRPEHDLLDGEEVKVGEEFSNGLSHPSEPNCRCSLLPVLAKKTWKTERDRRMRKHYNEIKAMYPQWEQAIEAVMETEPGLSFETVRRICHSK